MSYLTTPGEFEREIRRGVLSHRSARLDALLRAIDQYITTQRRSRLLAVQAALLTWHQTDPKEYADRAARAGPQLASSITALLENWGRGEIRIADPGAHPEYRPAMWNQPQVQYSTNCYAYACNDAYGHLVMSKPQPGDIGPWGVGQASGPEVRLAVMGDDLERRRRQFQSLVPLIRLREDAVPGCVANMAGHYLVALFVAPGVDYHWVRQDRDGMWSHKPGWGAATDRDSSGQPIADPRDCDMRIVLESEDSSFTLSVPYVFETFYYVPRGGVRTGSLGHRRR